MQVGRRQFLVGAGTTMAALMAGCGAPQQEGTADAGQALSTSALALDKAAWRYDADDDVYYQLGVKYCEKPTDTNYQTLAIFVPGKFMKATDNGNDTFTCTRDEAQKVGAYTAATAPIVMPIDTPGYSAMKALTAYESKRDFTSEGLVYVHAGCRGRDAGAPAGVTDLKAAVRFLRHVASDIAGSVDRIFTFGMSGGGAQSALMGATGDAAEYEPYLTAIGAVPGVSDAVCGSMDWCPITGLDVADEAYEWMMGCTRSDLSEEEQAISDGLAQAYAAWVNQAGIVDKTGATLALEEAGNGIYQAGSYYELVRQTIEDSLNNFLSDTEFPYEAKSSSHGPGGQGGPGGAGRPMREVEVTDEGELPEDLELPEEAATEDGATPGNDRRAKGPLPDTGGDAPTDADATSADEAATTDGEQAIEERDNIQRAETTGGVSLSGTYQTAADYIEALNADGAWVTYDEAANTATIASVADFCGALKRASKSLGAFDQLDRGQGENELFGVDGSPLHFDAMLADVLKEAGSSSAADVASDLAKKDAQGTDVTARVAMYTPLYYLLETQKGYGKSEPAKYWRIRTGINQGDTALTTELNLALALEADKRVTSVDFATVWGQGHTEAERTGSSDENFIAWVKECVG